jgi:hypothetical protein
MSRFAALAVCSIGLCLAPQPSGPPRGWTAAEDFEISSSNSAGNDETSRLSSGQFPKESHNPDLGEQKRLRVTWEGALLGYYDTEVGRDEFNREEVLTTVWKNCGSTDPLRRLAIKGKLLLMAEDGKAVRPVDWAQGVRVVIARDHKDRPDWSKRHDKKDSAWSDCVVERDGTFLATFPLHEIRRPVGRTESFQVALSLGTKAGQTITWKNSVPVLPQSVGAVKITGPDPLSPALQAICGAPSVGQKGFNPAALVRAVNHLQALGKDRAIAELRAFLKIARACQFVERDPANIDTSDRDCVFLIVRLLFEPADPKGQRPWLRVGRMLPSPAAEDKALWPLFPLALQDDIPFIVMDFIDSGWVAKDPGIHVDWAEKHGKLRARPLRPADDPLRAAEDLGAQPPAKKLLGEPKSHLGGMLRRQGYNMVKSIVKLQPGSFEFYPCPNYDADADWKELRKNAAKLSIRWDVQKQTYVVK